MASHYTEETVFRPLPLSTQPQERVSDTSHSLLAFVMRPPYQYVLASVVQAQALLLACHFPRTIPKSKSALLWESRGQSTMCECLLCME